MCAAGEQQSQGEPVFDWGIGGEEIVTSLPCTGVYHEVGWGATVVTHWPLRGAGGAAQEQEQE